MSLTALKAFAKRTGSVELEEVFGSPLVGSAGSRVFYWAEDNQVVGKVLHWVLSKYGQSFTSSQTEKIGIDIYVPEGLAASGIARQASYFDHLYEMRVWTSTSSNKEIKQVEIANIVTLDKLDDPPVEYTHQDINLVPGYDYWSYEYDGLEIARYKNEFLPGVGQADREIHQALGGDQVSQENLLATFNDVVDRVKTLRHSDHPLSRLSKSKQLRSKALSDKDWLGEVYAVRPIFETPTYHEFPVAALSKFDDKVIVFSSGFYLNLIPEAQEYRKLHNTKELLVVSNEDIEKLSGPLIKALNPGISFYKC